MSKLDPRIERILDDLKVDCKSSPRDWQQFYLFIKSKQVTGKKDPPVPLILAASGESDANKHRRLSDQIYWAKENDCLDEVISYLDNIPVEGWNSGPMDRWSQDSYPHFSYGWTSDPKPQMNQELKANLIERLLDNWDEIAGPELRGVTTPIRFSGVKGRRLIVFAKDDASPPWGTWTMLDQGENRRSFTRLRAAVNKVIDPFEVDHIDFVINPPLQHI